jgi:hypothetical protein
MINVQTASTAELLAFFNANTGGAQVKKFADRKTAERRVSALIAEMIEEGDAEGYDMSGVTIVDSADAQNEAWYGHTHCPACGINLGNGVTTYEDLRSNKNHDVDTKGMTHEYMCLGCGACFGPEIVRKTAKPVVSTGKLRPAMQASLKLDRRMRQVETGQEWVNPLRMRRENPEWMTSSQQDRLTKLLYTAAKAGTKAQVTINGRTFELVNV